MSDKSNNQGRAFEYVFVNVLKEEIEKRRSVEIEKNSSYLAAENAWNDIESSMRDTLRKGAIASCNKLFEAEVLLTEDGGKPISLKLQPDKAGEEGDVRDVLAIRGDMDWEIGFSLKHNHFAVKHSRLSKNLDFGKSWYNVPCSKEYWDGISPIFDSLSSFKEDKKLWRDIPDKAKTIYVPLLDEFATELTRVNEKDSDLPKKMVEYLLGKFDFYKVVSKDNERKTEVQAYNMHGDLNKKGLHSGPLIEIPLTELPTRIIHVGVIPGSDNTVEMVLDKGWSFTFRIHNASTMVETSLKFDIQLIGMPTSVITINCPWD